MAATRRPTSARSCRAAPPSKPAGPPTALSTPSPRNRAESEPRCTPSSGRALPDDGSVHRSPRLRSGRGVARSAGVRVVLPSPGEREKGLGDEGSITQRRGGGRYAVTNSAVAYITATPAATPPRV